MFKFLKKRFAPPSRAGRSTRASRPASFRPRLEHLEDRQLLAVAAGAHGEVFYTKGADRVLWERDAQGNTFQVGIDPLMNVTALSAGANGDLDVVRNGRLYKLDATGMHYIPGGDGAQSVAAGPNGEVYATFYSDRQLWKLDTAGWHYMTSWVTSVSAGANGDVDAVFINTTLRKYDVSGWHYLADQAQSVAAGPNGEVYATFYSDRQLWKLDTAGWQYMTYGVTSVSAGANGDVDAVFTDTTLWRKYDATGFHYIDSGVNLY